MLSQSQQRIVAAFLLAITSNPTIKLLFKFLFCDSLSLSLTFGGATLARVDMYYLWHPRAERLQFLSSNDDHFRCNVAKLVSEA